MQDELHEEIRRMLLDIVDNMPGDKNSRCDWLLSVVVVASKLAKEVK